MEKKIQTDQFAELAAAVVQSLPRDMDPNTAQGWITNREALAKVLWEALVPPSELQTLLTQVDTFKIQLEDKFNEHEFFKVNTEKNAPVKISYIGNNFKAWFFPPSASEEAVPGSGPYRTPGVQKNVMNAGLRYHTLNKRSVDGPIIEQLGGEAKAETTLAEIAACMKKQASGEAGALLTNGYVNIFYVRDVNSVLRAVYVFWHGVGWRVFAYSVEHPDEWRGGYRVFSRDS